MKRNLSLEMASLLIISAISLQAFADDATDKAKLNQAADHVAACVDAKDMQKVFIYYDGTDASLDAQIEAYAQDDTRLQNRVLNCVNDLGNAMGSVQTSQTFTQKMKDRLNSLLGSVVAMAARAKEKMGRGESMKIQGNVATIGIRG